MKLKKGNRTKTVNSDSKAFIAGLMSTGWEEVKKGDDTIAELENDINTIVDSIELSFDVLVDETIENLKEENTLHEQYFEKYGKEVSNRYKNNIEWIKSKLK